MSYILNINFQIPDKNFLGKSAFEPGLLFLQETPLFRTRHFSLIYAKPLYQNVRIDHRIIFTCS